ncbi:MAG: alpha/beta fold hydrolase [Salibacteraceae bacterium]
MKSTFPVNQIAFSRNKSFTGKPTIIFLHDSLGCIELWRDFPNQLSEITQCNTLVYDRQGYGKSCDFTYSQRDNLYMEHEADILIQLLDYWNLEKAILFGHSDGGSIALIAAGKYPDRIQGVITQGAHVFVEDVTLKGINHAVELYHTTNLKSKLEKYHGNKTNDLFWAWAKTWNTPEFKSWNIESFLPSIICKSLIIQGEMDEYGTLNQVHQIIKGTSGLAKQLIIPNIGHSPHKENLEITLTESARFILGLNS